jgi:hypothetical protein
MATLRIRNCALFWRHGAIEISSPADELPTAQARDGQSVAAAT